MKQGKRVEVVINSRELSKLLRVLEEEGVTGYTVIEGVKGKGGRGERMSDDLTGVFRNSYVMTACPAERAAGLVEAVRPLLERYGGICLVSDAQWIVY